MSDDRLGSLLQQADRQAGPPPALHGDLAGRVRRRARRGRVMRSAAVLAVVVSAVLASSLWRSKPRREPAVHDQPERAIATAPDVREELAAIRDEIRQCRALVDRLEIAARHRTLRAALKVAQDRLEPVEKIERERNQAALTLVRLGDRFRRLPGRDSSTAAATEHYRQVVLHFPETIWAHVARQRLSTRDNENPPRDGTKPQGKGNP